MTYDATTPTNPNVNDCERFEERLMAYLERELDLASRDMMERHRRDCPRCDALVGEIESVAAQASSLPSLSPDRDLWPGIEARLGTQVTPLFSAAPSSAAAPPSALSSSAAASHAHVAGSVASQPAPLAASKPARRMVSLRVFAVAATMLIAVSSAVTWQLSRTPAASADSVAVAGTNTAGVLVPVANAGVVYEQEIAALRSIVNERFTELDSTTVEVLRRNLAIIDKAIEDSREALEKDPGSRVLSTTLDRALQSKLELMRRVALL